ncbi:general secretion pathway protein E [Desulfocicer vacuolatum DSM 3385]|uniref:General secretion pathway protein E n=1 Tax=Desulfocicer vacuolatum DSM 3385 TaxID=1121400 RepID=A0A1W1ZH61_9BACT|nr:GspE/PulE family protein [Desulfocicer vacuolatum]SMC47704.1 general secretion pathway protein E [Desulfocicer vacuolatum DSM 3385]
MKPSKEIAKILFNSKLLSGKQINAALKNEPDIRKALRKQQQATSKENSSSTILPPIYFMDVLLALKLKKQDDSGLELDEDLLYETLAAGWQLPYKKIDPLTLDLNVVTQTIPHSFALRHLVLPLKIEGKTIHVATPNPFNHEAMGDIERVSGFKASPVVSPKTDVMHLISECFGFRKSITAAETQFSQKSKGELGNLEQLVHLKSSNELPATDQHIVNAVDHLFSYALEQRASDIHIEPKRKKSLVRMRIDGVLHTVYTLPGRVHNAIISRIKTLSGLNMAEKRRPQDGRIKTKKDKIEVEIRVSTIPVAFGEKAVLRLMDPEVLFQDLPKLGFSREDLEKYNNIITLPHGIILVTGPTGSGKSTTLYSTLKQLSTPAVNITTIEDPIEMIHEDFNQIAVQPAIDVTFSTILKNILRQDPDIIMVGEIRDLDTAQNAVQAALTGHLVLSTLHTNDAVSSLTRLLDLGIPPFLVQSSLVGIIAQRLVRRICPHCRESFEMDEQELFDMGIQLPVTRNQSVSPTDDRQGQSFKKHLFSQEPGAMDLNNLAPRDSLKTGPKRNKITLHRGKGCIKCRHTGYRGRSAIFEVLPYSDALKKMTAGDVNVSSLRKRAGHEGLKTLREDAVLKMLNGETTFEEVLRVTWQGDG